MANIKKHLDNIKGALFGKEVRSSIHDGIDAINKEVESTTNRQEHLEGTFDQLGINSGNSNAEIVDARVGENGKSYAKLGDRLDEVDSQLEHIENRDIISISIEDYAHLSNGDDYSYCLQYIIDNIANNDNKVIINFKDGKTYNLNANINKRYITLKGSAIIKGMLNIGFNDDDELMKDWYESFIHCEILGLSFIPSLNFPDWQSNVNYGIRLKNARSVVIKGCYFANMLYPILLESRDVFEKQHNNRIRIIDCTFFVCGYNLYSSNIDKNATGDEFMEHGDIEFRGCSCQETKLGNIYLCAIDGFTCFDNIFFLERTGHNIKIRYAMGVLMNGNQLFEPGLSCLYLDHIAYGNVSNNQFAYGGKINNDPSVNIIGLDPYNNSGCQLVINGNVIDNCFGDGIKISGGNNEHGTKNISITNNLFHLRNASYKPLVMKGYSLGCVVLGNTSNVELEKAYGYSITSNNATSKHIYAGNSVNFESIFINGEETKNDLILNKTDTLIVFSGSNGCIDNINTSNCFNGQKLYVVSDWVNNTIKMSDNLVTKNGTDLTLGRNGYREFIYLRGKLREV